MPIIFQWSGQRKWEKESVAEEEEKKPPPLPHIILAADLTLFFNNCVILKD